jgi:bile acid:Na+ symporter, BASS family
VRGFIVSLSHFLHRRLIWFLLASYAIAAVAPSFGLWMRDVSVWRMRLFQENTHISVPMLILAFLLLNAGLGIRMTPKRQSLRSVLALGSGVAGNLFIPLLFILLITQILRLWHNPEEVQNILVGLALVASMPIAGSSTAWSQNADGDMGLSLGLVLLSTFLSPLTTPLVLHSVGFLTTGDYSRNLHELAGYGAGAFLMLFVLLPSLAGMATRGLAGERAVAAARPHLKVINIFALLILSYSNAAVSLPRAIAHPDLDFLLITLAIVTGLCMLAFASGLWIARAMRANQPQEAALMFGLGMNNNGTGLVLASATLADHPLVMLPIIFYNLVQHLVAGVVDYVRYRNTR